MKVTTVEESCDQCGSRVTDRTTVYRADSHATDYAKKRQQETEKNIYSRINLEMEREQNKPRKIQISGVINFKYKTIDMQIQTGIDPIVFCNEMCLDDYLKEAAQEALDAQEQPSDTDSHNVDAE